MGMALLVQTFRRLHAKRCFRIVRNHLLVLWVEAMDGRLIVSFILLVRFRYRYELFTAFYCFESWEYDGWRAFHVEADDTNPYRFWAV